MKEILDALRGPALGVVIMFILLGGAVVITAFAALIAQMGLLLRMRPQQMANPTETDRQRETTLRRYSARRRVLGGRIKP